MKRILSLTVLVSCGLSLAGCSLFDQPKPKEGAKLTQPRKLPPSYPPRKDVPADLVLRNKARQLLLADAKSTDPFTRAHAIEAIKIAIPSEAPAVALNNLADNAPLVRFASLMTAGELRLADARGPALQMVAGREKNLQVASIFVLHRLGDTRFSHLLEKTALDDDRRVRANTALVLGQLNEPSASKILKRMLQDLDPVVRLQAAEAMWRLHNQDALETLVSATISRYPDDQMIAAIALAAPRDPRVTEHLRGMLTTNYPEVNLVAARAMGQLGSDEGYGVATKALENEDPRQRHLAALALGAIGRLDSQSSLAPLLDDKQDDVRLAAATAILQLH